MEKLIITAALTGGEVTRKQQPNLPLTPDEIAEAAYECYLNGVSIVHVHARDTNGDPTQDYETNKIIAEKLIFSIEFLKNSKSLKDVADYNNFRLHELKYERKGQFAIDLGKTTGYRLIIEPVTVNKENEIISYESINIVEIMEVSNHYE